MNKLVRHNLVRGLPTKCFETDHNCTACLKGKQHKVSCKSKLVNSVSKPLHTLHMDLFGPTSGIKREFSNARTPQQNGVAERRNRSLIEAARIMLADAKLPVTFWAEAVNTACYVQNKTFQRKSTVRSQYRAPWVPPVNRNFPPVNRKFSTGDRNFPTVNKKFSTASRKFPTGSTKGPTADMGMKGKP
nr:putative ribonuclease H-like domain-containing protein [Tanacetum cinerariifolium]